MTVDKDLEGQLQGKVKWFNVKKGFGFITRNDSGEDIFVHRTELAKDKSKRLCRSLEEGELVDFELKMGKKGAEAARVVRRTAVTEGKYHHPNSQVHKGQHRWSRGGNPQHPNQHGEGNQHRFRGWWNQSGRRRDHRHYPLDHSRPVFPPGFQGRPGTPPRLYRRPVLFPHPSQPQRSSGGASPWGPHWPGHSARSGYGPGGSRGKHPRHCWEGDQARWWHRAAGIPEPTPIHHRGGGVPGNTMATEATGTTGANDKVARVADPVNIPAGEVNAKLVSEAINFILVAGKTTGCNVSDDKLQSAAEQILTVLWPMLTPLKMQQQK